MSTSDSAAAGTPARQTYSGPIEVGMHFIWEKDKPHAFAIVRVENIRPPTLGESEAWIQTITVSGGIKNATGELAWNEEGRCREAFTPCNESGVELKLEAVVAPVSGEGTGTLTPLPTLTRRFTRNYWSDTPNGQPEFHADEVPVTVYLASEVEAWQAAKEADKVLLDLLTTSKSPCGHWGSHAYSPDGKGKQILCLDCEVAAKEAQLAELREQIDDFGDRSRWKRVAFELLKAANWAEALSAIHLHIEHESTLADLRRQGEWQPIANPPETRIRVWAWDGLVGRVAFVDFDGSWKDDFNAVVPHPIECWRPLPDPPT